MDLLEVALARNQYSHSALSVMARAYYVLENGDRMREVAKRRVTIDPLNPQSVRMLGAAWELAGQADSTHKYRALADSGLAWAVSVSQFAEVETGTIVNALLTNISQRPLVATALVFEFLDIQGNVIATASAEVPALEPGGRAPLSLRAHAGGAVAWRYRRR